MLSVLPPGSVPSRKVRVYAFLFGRAVAFLHLRVFHFRLLPLLGQEGRSAGVGNVKVREFWESTPLLPQGHFLLPLLRFLPPPLACCRPFHQVLQRREILLGEGCAKGRKGEAYRNVRSSFLNSQR